MFCFNKFNFYQRRLSESRDIRVKRYTENEISPDVSNSCLITTTQNTVCYFLLKAVRKLKKLCHHRVFFEPLDLLLEPGAGMELNALTVKARSSFKSVRAALFKFILS